MKYLTKKRIGYLTNKRTESTELHILILMPEHTGTGNLRMPCTTEIYGTTEREKER